MKLMKGGGSGGDGVKAHLRWKTDYNIDDKLIMKIIMNKFLTVLHREVDNS